MIIKFLSLHKGNYFTISIADSAGTPRDISLDRDMDNTILAF
jgi:hypothetical protein